MRKRRREGPGQRPRHGGNEGSAQIGDGGRGAFHSATVTNGVALMGDVKVVSIGSSISVGGGNGSGSFAQIGDGGRGFGYALNAASLDLSGNVALHAANTISVTGGTFVGAMAGAFAQVGNGGQAMLESATLSGGATVAGYVSVLATGGAGGPVVVSGGIGDRASAQIGNGGRGFGYRTVTACGALVAVQPLVSVIVTV